MTQPGKENRRALHRHARHALEDFEELRRERWNEKLWHSLSHHLRHSVYRSGVEINWNKPVWRSHQ